LSLPVLPGSEPAASPGGFKKTFDALSIKNYRWYWLGFLAAFLANYILIPSQAWLAYDLTHSAFKLGLVSAAQGIPMIAISLFSGGIIDRVRKRSVIISTQVLTLLNTLSIAILIQTGNVEYWHLLLSSFLAGTILAFNTPTRMAIVAELVPREKLFNAFALNNGGSNTARIAGPALAGILIAFAGTQAAYFCSVAFYLVATLTMTLIKPGPKPAAARGETVLDNLRGGFQFLKLHNIIIILIVMEFAITLFGMPYQGLMPVFADILSITPDRYGFMLSAVGIGALVGSLTVASLGNYKRKGLLLLIAGTCFGVMVLLFGNSANLGSLLHIGPAAYYLALFFLMIIGMSSSSYTATSSTVIQMSASDEFRGRVTSFFSIIMGLYPISIMIAGTMSEAFGAPRTLTIWGICLVVFMLIMAFSTSRIRSL